MCSMKRDGGMSLPRPFSCYLLHFVDIGISICWGGEFYLGNART
jgi:hypothetical protein